jgi:hypothetical protein
MKNMSLIVANGWHLDNPVGVLTLMPINTRRILLVFIPSQT